MSTTAPPAYEFADVSERRRRTLANMAALMGVSLTEAEVERVRELCAFEHMKAIDHKFYPGKVSPFARPGGQMIRSGKQGNSGEMARPAGAYRCLVQGGTGEARQRFPVQRYFGASGR